MSNDGIGDTSEKTVGGDAESVENLTFYLAPLVVHFHNEDSEKQWVSDDEYFQGLSACEWIRSAIHHVKYSVSHALYCVNHLEFFAKPTGESYLSGQELSRKLQGLLERLEAKFEMKLRAMKKRPVLEKLADNLMSSDSHRSIIRLLICNFVLRGAIGTHDNVFEDGNYVPRLPAVKVQAIFSHSRKDIHLSEILALFSPESEWVKERFLTGDPGIRGSIGSVCMLPDPAIKVFMGIEIPVESYHCLPGKALQNILLDDEWFQSTESGRVLKEDFDRSKAAMEQMKKRKDGAPSLLKAALQESIDTKPNKKCRVLEVLTMAKKTPSAAASLHEVDSKSSKSNEDEKRSPDDAVRAQPLNDAEDKTAPDEMIDEFAPYKSDLDYLEDQVKRMQLESSLNALKAQLKQTEVNPEVMEEMWLDHGGPRIMQHRHGDRNSKNLEHNITELEQKHEKLKDRIQAKLARTQEETDRQLRLEQLCEALHLSKFERNCILSLVSFVISPPKRHRGNIGRSETVGTLIDSFCGSLEERMESRRYFYRSNTLIREGILTLAQPDFKTDLSECMVELDRRMFDFIVGLDTEFSEIVDGSHLYFPNVNLDDVVLPPETKKRVCDSVINHDKVKAIFENLQVDEKITYGLGNVVLFYGHSGVGKTMLANAIATKLKKKVLLVNFPNLGTNMSGEIIKFLFREARINNALLFFDECESIFLSRNKGGTSVNMILTEMERFDGLCILATNRAYDLDEAMHRRISLAIEFRKPDHILREEIWKALKPPLLLVDDDINYGILAKKYELTGGLIKNAWLNAVSLMVRREGKSISQEDLMQAAGEQVVGQLSMEDFDRRVVPTMGIDKIAVAKDIHESLHSIIHYAKAQSVLFGQWGFDELHRATTGITALFTGAPGTGKSMAAEAVGFDLGRPLLVVNVAELVDKYVGETGKNIQRVFADAKKKDAVLVFDEAEGLFATRGGDGSHSTSRHDSMNVGILLQQIESFNGVCIAITNMEPAIDAAFFRRFRFVLNFEMPDTETRERIWKSMVPVKCPLAKDVDLRELAARYEMAGGNMKNAFMRAATTAALRDAEKDRVVTMEDLTKACSAELEKQGSNHDVKSIYS